MSVEPTAEQRARWDAYTAKRERERKSRAVRIVAIRDGGDGHCRWCARPLIGTRGKSKGKIDRTRSWCRDADGRSACLNEWLLHSRAENQFDWLVEHRGERCAGCRKDKPMRERDLCGYSETVSDLQVDHVVPLWLVAIIVPPEDRRPYFGPINLQLLCGICHKAKTKREAAERAMMKRQLALEV